MNKIKPYLGTAAIVVVTLVVIAFARPYLKKVPLLNQI